MSKNFFNIVITAGARPNFVKIAPIIKELDIQIAKGTDITYSLVHTGQHYDKNMSETFFQQLGIPKPDTNLNCGSGTQSEITAKIMILFEKYLQNRNTDLVIVVGDVTSTVACSIVAKKMNIKLAHVEGGIRSGDLTMPEEINRIITDSITDYFFTTSEFANQNLIDMGINKKNIFFVGNTMIDSLKSNISKLTKPKLWNIHGLKKREYIVITLHRPANVDKKNLLKQYILNIVKHSGNKKLVFPVHPRTRKVLKNLDLEIDKLILCDPISYLEFNFLVKNSFAVITDSGGITEEATFMNIPCMTLRDNTERPETILIGTNILVGTNPNNIKKNLKKLLAGKWKKGSIPKYWDGKTSARIVKQITKLI